MTRLAAAARRVARGSAAGVGDTTAGRGPADLYGARAQHPEQKDSGPEQASQMGAPSRLP